MKKWNEISKLSKITLLKNNKFNGFNGPFTLKKGNYYITGFWANACGLSLTRKDALRGASQVFIPAGQLKKFENIV